jgi:hypothetical protein
VFCQNPALRLLGQSDKENYSYTKWLQLKTSAPIALKTVHLTAPTHFGDIYEAATGVVKETLEHNNEEVDLTYHLSPGTPAKAAIYDDMLEITSPGPLRDTLPVEELGTGRSEIRNRVLAPIFKELKLIEAWGSGIQKIRK